MLQPCPECQLQVSDRAITCPHCGYPLKENIVRQRASRKRKALPNGFGQISFIKGNLRKPYRAMVSVGKYPNGRPICKILKPEGYFETYNDAYAALVEYHKNPYDLDSGMLMDELYEKWSEQFFKTLKKDSLRGYISAWKYCSSVYKMRVKDVRVRHIKGCIENGTAMVRGEVRTTSNAIKSHIKTLFNHMMDYAVEYELTDKNYARLFELSLTERKSSTVSYQQPHIPFTEEELKILWENYSDDYLVKMILFQCYTGWRPQEMGLLEITNVDLEHWFITGGMKTENGVNRIVPVHPKVRSILKESYEEAVSIGSKYLFNCMDRAKRKKEYFMSYSRYNYRFNSVLDELKLNPEHNPHDPRMHFATSADKYKVDPNALKRILGHAISDVTERHYIKRTPDWLMEEVCKIESVD